MKLFNKNGAETPRIAELAEDGVIFRHAFSNCPVCSAARSTLETGCYGPRIGTHFHRKFKTVPLPEGLRLFPAYLKQAGYYTSNKKKTDYNFIAKKGGWDSSKDWRGRKAGQPFFHKQSFATTHEGKLHRVKLTGPLSEEEKRTFIHPYFPDTPLFRKTAATYHELHRKMDGEIGRVVDLGRGTDADGFVSFIDFGPTLLHLAGLDVPEGVDGRPFMGPGISRADLEARDETFGNADRFDEKYDLVRTVRKGRYKYMRNYQPFNIDSLQNNYRYKMAAYREWRDLYKAGKLNEVQSQFHEPRAPEALYDIETDPYETRNIAGDPAHAATLARLRARMTEFVKGLPDLSFYPESELAKRAFGNPTGFGRKRKADIARLVDIADLALVPFAEARVGIKSAIASDDPWQRYWGLIVCSAFCKEAVEFAGEAKKIAAGDSEPLVRVGAAEFLGLAELGDPVPVIKDVLAKAEHPLEALLALNTAVLLRDGKPGYEFKVSPADVKAKQGEVKRRLDYLR